MVKEQIPVFILNSGARTEATRMRLTPRKGYVMSSHYPLEVRDLSCLTPLYGHFQHLDHVVPSPVVPGPTILALLVFSTVYFPIFSSIPLVHIVRQRNVVINLSPTLQ